MWSNLGKHTKLSSMHSQTCFRLNSVSVALNAKVKESLHLKSNTAIVSEVVTIFRGITWKNSLSSLMMLFTKSLQRAWHIHWDNSASLMSFTMKQSLISQSTLAYHSLSHSQHTLTTMLVHSSSDRIRVLNLVQQLSPRLSLPRRWQAGASLE